MPKARINKFIFHDGKLYLRVKTTAKDLKLKKVDSNYSIEFVPRPENGALVTVPVVLVDDFKIPDDAVDSQNFGWGRFLTTKTSGDNPECCHYVTPNNQNFAVKFGPISARIEITDLAVDWPNIQWGIE